MLSSTSRGVASCPRQASGSQKAKEQQFSDHVSGVVSGEFVREGYFCPERIVRESRFEYGPFCCCVTLFCLRALCTFFVQTDSFFLVYLYKDCTSFVQVLCWMATEFRFAFLGFGESETRFVRCAEFRAICVLVECVET